MTSPPTGNDAMDVPWVVGVAGASGTPHAKAALAGMIAADQPVELVISRAARLTILDATGLTIRDGHWRDDLAAWLERDAVGVRYHPAGDLAAAPASGSYPTRWPASTAWIAGIALGLSKDLLQRSADVTLKERRTLVVVPGETRYTPSHVAAPARIARRRRDRAPGKSRVLRRCQGHAAAGRLRRGQGPGRDRSRERHDPPLDRPPRGARKEHPE
jgi:4-hydroxy-3-polyprenylbenzoate decarboxylase